MSKIKSIYRSLPVLILLQVWFSHAGFSQITPSSYCVIPGEDVNYYVSPSSPVDYNFYTTDWSITGGSGIFINTSSESCTIRWTSLPGQVGAVVNYYLWDGFAYRLVDQNSYGFNVQSAPTNLTNQITRSTSQTGFYANQIPNPIIEAVPIVSGGACTPAVAYKWYKSSSPSGPFELIPGAQSSQLSFSAPLTGTTYYQREIMMTNGTIFLSNVVQLSLLDYMEGPTCINTLGQELSYAINVEGRHPYTFFTVEWIIPNGAGEAVYKNGERNATITWYSLPAQLTTHITWWEYIGPDEQNNPMYATSTEDNTFTILPNSTALANVIGSSTGKTSFWYSQVPDALIETVSTSGQTTCSSLNFQWVSSASPLGPFTPVSGATGAQINFSQPLQQTTYYRRIIKGANGAESYSNTIRFDLVSANWENRNYVREHTVLVPGITDWKVIDQLPIGQKAQTTAYFDGIARVVEKVDREAATPENGGILWGDIVQFFAYDPYGRQPKQYLPYSAGGLTGQFRPNVIFEQETYYEGRYNEANPYSFATFENSPLNRVTNLKSPGTTWSQSPGNETGRELNDATDNVQIFNIGFASGDIPVRIGTYGDNTLVKTVHTDENNNKAIEYTNSIGQLICKKVQLDNSSTAPYAGWICTYFIYDDFGRLRYELQPEAVKWLDGRGWSFNDPDAPKVLNEFCFRYEYDESGRTVLRKAPGAKEVIVVYDKRSRIVYRQDGNQRAATTGEWMVSFYDELDREVLTGLYKTTKTVNDLITDANNTITFSPVNIPVPAIPANFLVVNSRDPGISLYKAGYSVEFNPGFESGNSDEFVAEIDPNMLVTSSAFAAVYSDPVPPGDVNDPSKFTALRYNFYDHYNYAGVKPFDNNFNNSQAYATGGTVDPIGKTARTLSMITGTKVRVLGTGTFLAATMYYDEKGRITQDLHDNIKSGTDITTTQRHFDGRVLSYETRHSAAGTAYSNYSILTKYVFDRIGRVSTIQKKYGTNSFKDLVAFEYDDLGRIKKKRLDPGYTGTGKTEIETLAYSYNLNGTITGINKDYALKTPGKYDKWGNFFGMYLGYDNRDNVFAARQLDGHVAGTLWTTQGDDAQRKYDYAYDNAGRLINAAFNEYTPASGGNPGNWNHTKMDFSVTGSNGKIEYDLNGNLIRLLQKGVIPGNQTPVSIDDLVYSYALSNKLLKVVDNAQTVAMGINGKLGDFTDGSNGGNDDYVYDDNGNLVTDLNKAVTALNGTTGIRYNFLDKPEEIRINGKGTLRIVYDAAGNKLQKIYTPDGSSTGTITSYIDEFVYRGDDLQYINFEEGRVRVMQTVSQSNSFDFLSIDGNMNLPGGKRGAYDFFIRDYQSNVRVIVTEETHTGGNTCSMEMARANNEEPVFGKVDANGTPTADNEVKARFAVSSIPGQTVGGGWQNAAIGSYVIRVGNLAGKKVGPNALLKVMAGDKISATSIYYFQNPVVNSAGGPTVLSDLLLSLGQAISGSPVTSGVTKGAVTSITSSLGANIPFSSLVDPDAGNASGNAPKAYLSVMFFDERFNPVSEGSLTRRVSEGGVSNATPLTIYEQPAPKNGYAYVYLSNVSDEMVYFDNLQVTHTRGRIVEENHYYAYGLKIQALSSRKLADPGEGMVDNKNLYNDKELFDEGDLNWYDYGLRNYDPQIGRFTQLDPLAFDYPFYTPYQYAGCEPIANTDLDGAEPERALDLATNLAKSGFIVTVNENLKTGITSVIWTEAGIARARRFIYSFSEMMPLTFSTPSMRRVITPPDSNPHPSDWMSSQVPKPVMPARAALPYEKPATISQAPKLTDYQIEQNRKALENIYQEMGLNPDGSKPWLVRVSENKYFNNFANNLVFPLAEGASYVTGAGEMIGAYRGWRAARALMRAEAAMYEASAAGWMDGSLVLGSDYATTVNAARMVPEPGIHQVLLHGNPDNFFVNTMQVSPKDLARKMLQSGYQRGTTVRLISCWTGVWDDGAAYQLSRYLKSPVMAPTNKVKILDGGSYFINDGGYWKTFDNTKVFR